MIRKYQPQDLEHIMKIWLETNLAAHGFIPAEYWNEQYEAVKEALPQADILDNVALGGEGRLNATSAGERASWMNALLVWGVLIAGVLLLTGMAWRIWRETQRKA